MDSHNRLRGRGCSGVSARPSDAAWTAVSSLCTPTPTCTSRSYVWFRVRSVMVVAPPVGAVCRAVERRGPRGPCPAERPCSHSAHLGKKVKDETTTHRGRTRSNEPIIEGSRYKKVEARRYKVKPQRRRAPPRRPDHGRDQETPKRRTPPLGPRPAATERYHDPLSVAELRYEILNTGESRSTRGTLLGRAYCYSSVLRARRVVAVCSDRARSHRHTITLVWWSGRCFPVFLFVCCTCGCVCHRDHEYEDLRV